MNMRLAILGRVLALMAQPGMAGPYEDGIAAYDRHDYAKAFKLFQPLAKKGDARGQFGLGLMYENGRGRGVPWRFPWDDDADAIKWYRLSANQGYALAEAKLGYAYHRGLLVSRDDAEAIKWLRKAADQGDAEAQEFVGLMLVSKDNVEAYMWLSLAARSPTAVWDQDYIAKWMTPGQIVEAKMLARKWLAAHPLQ